LIALYFWSCYRFRLKKKCFLGSLESPDDPVFFVPAFKKHPVYLCIPTLLAPF
jgi:hypothetical protein